MQWLIMSVLCSLPLIAYSGQEDPSMKKTTLIAHRGVSSEAPENTLAAFKRALELGLPFVEMDIHLSEDGIPVVIHDANLSRTTSETKAISVAEVPLQYIENLDAGSWFNEHFVGEGVPTLEQVLTLLWGKIGLMLELKSSTGQTAELAKAVLTVLDRWHNKPNDKTVVIGSFSKKIICAVRKLDARQAVMGITETDEGLNEYLNMGLKHIAISKDQATRSMLKLLKQNDVRTWVYTVDKAEQAQELADWGVEGIISNDPRTLQGAFSKKNI